MFISAQTVKITELQSLELAGVGIAITIAVLAFLMGFVYLLAFIIRKIEASGFSLASLIKKKKVAEEVSSPETLPEKASGSASWRIQPSTSLLQHHRGTSRTKDDP